MQNHAQTTDRLKKATDATVDAIEEKAIEGLEHARKKAKDTVDKAQELEADVSLAAKEATASIVRYINDKPVQAAGIAFAAGVLATLILKKN